MKKTLLLFILFVLIRWNGIHAQKILGGYYSKKLVTIPVTADSSASEDFCVCKVITFSSENNMQRTDAIFAGSSPARPLSKKELLRHIDYELQQALVFFDSYKLINQFASAVDCNTLYRYLKEQQDGITSHSTFLLSTYASR